MYIQNANFLIYSFYVYVIVVYCYSASISDQMNGDSEFHKGGTFCRYLAFQQAQCSLPLFLVCQRFNNLNPNVLRNST